MIAIGNLNTDRSQFDEVWGIVRSSRQLPKDVFHAPLLSPSNELFQQYLHWRAEGEWTQEKFDKEYTPIFKQELQNPKVQTLLKNLIKKAETKNILLVCFCKDERMCHRKLVFEEIERLIKQNTD